MTNIGLIVRCKDEPYMLEFVDYYLKQGVNRIYIVDDDSDPSIYNQIINNSNIEILYNVNNIKTTLSNQFERCNELYNKIRNDYDWMIVVDADEFIGTKKNLTNTIRDELETTFKDAYCIKIPWVMMACNSIEKNPTSLLKTNIYRMNNDIEHPNKTNIPKFVCKYKSTFVKCIFKPKYFGKIDMHIPLMPISENIIFIDSIYLRKREVSIRFYNLREKTIKHAHLLCYHYRIISKENCENKIANSKIYQLRKITVNDMMLNDFPELIDETMKNKAINLQVKDNSYNLKEEKNISL